MAIDRWDWHSGGDFPKDLPDEAGGTHIGFFLYWLITRGHIGDEQKEDERALKDMTLVREGRMTGRDFLFKHCDGKFWDADVARAVLPFVHWYYDKTYYEDLADFCARYETIYHAEDSVENAVAVAKLIDARFTTWTRQRGRPA
jgi:hypothetical protein